ncbi:MAG: hypothetical protein K1X73_03215 [Bacteroidia bacterium]|nr:hypothetical protein [Bacteroidia bacterium]MCC7514154.1 hypothetical protein [Bacteroidia bacterium]HMU76724.1 hypothetical protein [Bacteroidia bacterium]HMW10152.1 hypothetical protein [Bacteroidia bacterium]HMX96880.1 hypothetical protein [Bacteroidia bacterium]
MKIMNRSIISFLILFWFCGSAKAQTDTTKNKSVNFYQGVEQVSKSSKLLRNIYRMIFRPVTSKVVEVKKKPVVQEINFSEFQCLPIGNINITVFDPFGYSLQDSVVKHQPSLINAGNFLHNKTSSSQIKKLMIIETGDEFDSLLVSESERLIRTQPYIRDAIIIPHKNELNQTIDLEVRVLDNWSILIGGGMSETNTKISITEKNFAGLGHTFENSYRWYYNKNADIIESSYEVPNLLGTHADAKILYHLNEREGDVKSIGIERPFYSPLTKYAGGILLEQHFVKAVYGEPSENYSERYKYNFVDAWSGYSIRLLSGNKVYQRSTRLIAALRGSSVQYLSFPSAGFDSLGLLKNQNTYLAGIGFSSREYITERYVFKYGQKEDVPIGRTYGLTVGYRERASSGNWYAGAMAAFGDYFSFGYLSSLVRYGTFFYNGNARNSAFEIQTVYFTRQMAIGKWRLRQFLRANATLGIDRITNEFVSLENQMSGFDSRTSGTKRIFISLQTQTYAPYDFLGFKFGPYVIASVGFIGNQLHGFSRSQMYSVFGVGMIIKNEFLALSSFQISLAYYPTIPYSGQDVFRVNPLRSTDFQLVDFDLKKPDIIEFK